MSPRKRQPGTSNQAPLLPPAAPAPGCAACGAAFSDAQQARIEVAYQQARVAELRQKVAAMEARAARAEHLLEVRTNRCKQVEARLVAALPAPRPTPPRIPGLPAAATAAPTPAATPAAPPARVSDLLEVD